jgi:tetratricopeptide (TPR) repeat protein
VVVQIVEKALAKDPAERFPSAAEMLAALRQARQAAAGGRGHERMPDLERTVAAPAVPLAPRPPDRGAVRRGGASRSGSSRSGSRSAPSAATGGRRGVVIGLVLSLLAVAVGSWAIRALVLGRPVSTPPPPEVASLAAAVIDAQVELARRKLEDGDFADAARQAERALKLDPASADARAVADEAAAGLARVTQAAAALRSAPGGRAAVDAAFELMRLDPGHPEAEAAARAAGAAFRGRAEEARRLAAEARAAAEDRGARRANGYADGLALEKQGEEALRSGATVAAAQRFLEARIRFERARPSAR